ncbi:MAG: hypothetical protein OSA09_04080, partial [Acidimicrobiales bacterium]|nr:hypothetical protein [Acidimicrobiales bacterium]
GGELVVRQVRQDDLVVDGVLFGHDSLRCGSGTTVGGLLEPWTPCGLYGTDATLTERTNNRFP